MHEYILDYPEKVYQYRAAWIISKQGQFDRECRERLDQARMSPGDYARASIHLTRPRIKELLQNCTDFARDPVMTCQDGKLHFAGDINKFSFTLESIGLPAKTLKNGARVVIAHRIAKQKGPLPHITPA